MLSLKPNPWQTASQWLYKTATILEESTTAFIIPLTDAKGNGVKGFYTVSPLSAEVKVLNGIEYLEFSFPGGNVGAIETSKVGLLTKYQHSDSLFGAGNKPIMETVELLNTQQQALKQGIVNNAAIRFIGLLAGVYKPKDIKSIREDFASNNLQSDGIGFTVVDEKFKDVKQVSSNQVYVDAEQLKMINQNVYKYFGTNEKIMSNSYSEEEWTAYYEGKIEPFAVQLEEVLTDLFQTQGAMPVGEEIMISANRLDCSGLKTKISVVTQLFDRGMLTVNQGLTVFGLPPVEDGDKLYIRKEYAERDKLNESQGVQDE